MINLTHTYRGDLKIELTSPSGTEVILHDRSGSGNDNVIGTYPDTLDPAESLTALKGESIRGQWKLTISDNAPADVGRLVSWGIQDIVAFECE